MGERADDRHPGNGLARGWTRAGGELAVDKRRTEAALLPPLTSGGPRGWQAGVKRSMGVVLAGGLLLVLLPMLLFVAVGVRLSSPGPVFFRQERIGRGGRIFTIVKFRTFPVEHVDAVVALNAQFRRIPFLPGVAAYLGGNECAGSTLT